MEGTPRRVPTWTFPVVSVLSDWPMRSMRRMDAVNVAPTLGAIERWLLQLSPTCVFDTLLILHQLVWFDLLLPLFF